MNGYSEMTSEYLVVYPYGNEKNVKISKAITISYIGKVLRLAETSMDSVSYDVYRSVYCHMYINDILIIADITENIDLSVKTIPNQILRKHQRKLMDGSEFSYWANETFPKSVLEVGKVDFTLNVSKLDYSGDIELDCTIDFEEKTLKVCYGGIHWFVDTSLRHKDFSNQMRNIVDVYAFAYFERMCFRKEMEVRLRSAGGNPSVLEYFSEFNEKGELCVTSK